MTILPDGRWRMSSAELDKRVWEKIKTWRLDPNDSRCLVPNFPECPRRSLQVLCQPCGRKSNMGYHCSKFDTLVSVTYCQDCVSKGNNLERNSQETSGSPQDNH